MFDTVAILVARGVIAAGGEIYKAIVGGESEAELLKRAREAGVALPERGGTDGAWAESLAGRLHGDGADPAKRDTEPPVEVDPNPYPEADK